MVFPLGTDRPIRSTTVVTYAFIAAYACVFAYAQVMDRQDPAWTRDVLDRFAISGRGFRWWQPVTYTFLHGGFAHLLGNCLFLYVFGPNIEDRLGKLGFLAFYLLGGAAAGGLHAFFETRGAIGASGAIAACTGAYLVMFPLTRVKVLSLLLYFGVFQLSAWWFIAGSIAWDVLMQARGRSGVAHLAHLGGYLFGASVGFLLLAARVVPREPYDLFSMARQARRRAELRRAAGEAQRRDDVRWARARLAESDETDGLARARAGVSARLAAGDLPGAAAGYRALAERFGHLGAATALPRRHQYDLANHLYGAGDATGAAFAYERFLDAYPRDPEAPQVRLLLGLIHARSFNDPVRAKALIKQARDGLRDPAAVELADRELAALG